MKKRLLAAFAVIALAAGLIFSVAAVAVGIVLFDDEQYSLYVGLCLPSVPGGSIWSIIASVFLFIALVALMSIRSGVRFLQNRTKENAIEVSIVVSFVIWVALFSMSWETPDSVFSPPLSVFSMVLAYVAFRMIKAFVVDPEYKQ